MNRESSTAKSLRVQSPDGEYEIVIAPGALVQGQHLGTPGGAVVITNTTLAPLYGEALAQRLGARLLTVPDGEQHKRLETVQTLYDSLVVAGADRRTTVIALGGGVLGDMAGFAAATYMRGLDFIQVPTSLLAMVDSSVGGKVGVDLPQGKNLVGAFKQPLRVLIDPEVLATLPAREWACGMAETIKHGLIGDAGLFEQIEADPGAYARFSTPSAAAALVARSVQVKIDLVQADPYERGSRAHLNLGHTFGHAVEQASGYAWPHGEGVGVGLLAAARLSARLGLCAPELPGRVERVVGGVGLPTRIGSLDPEAICAAMATDKKFVAGKSRFILIRSVGAVGVVEDVPKPDLLQVLGSMQ